MHLSREIQLILILLVLIGFLAMVIQFFKTDADQSSASNFVIEDLQEKYPEYYLKEGAELLG